jgi:hypothetical protein
MYQMIMNMFTMEMFPFTLLIAAIIMFVLGQNKSSVCGENQGCNSFLDKANQIAIGSAVSGVVLMMLICLGCITVSGSMMGGFYGGMY